MIKKTAIIGIGGVGGFFGGKICKEMESSPDHEVYFIARGRHLEEIQNYGLILKTENEGTINCIPTLATENVEDLPVLDLCIVCVKSFDLNQILEDLKPKIKPETIILPLLNGVDIYERVRNILKDGIVLPASVYVGTHIEKPGTVTQKGGTCEIIFGEDPQNPGSGIKGLNKFLDQAKIKHRFFENVYPEIWKKFVFIASFGLVTSAFNKTLGEIMESEEIGTKVKSIMSEILLLSKSLGIHLPENIIEESFLKGNHFPYDTKTSFQRDYEFSDKPDERDLFGGTIIRLGKENNISCQTTENIYELLTEKNL